MITNYPTEGFDAGGTFNSLTWAVSTHWSGPVRDEDTSEVIGTTSGSFSGNVNQDNEDLTDFNVNVEISTAEAEDARNGSNSIKDVAAKIKATVTIEVTGQHMRSSSMGAAAAKVRFYVGAVDAFHEVGEAVPLHWNTGSLTVTLTDFLNGIDLSDGDQQLHVVVDADSEVNESDESNNEFTAELPFDLAANVIGWLIGPGGVSDGIVVADYSVGVAGFNNSTFGSTTMAIYFADAFGTWLDADPSTELIDPLAFRSISSLSTPDSADGNFLQFTSPLSWRPEGATQIVAAIDLNNIPQNNEDHGNNLAFLPLTELEVSDAHWNDNGSIDFNVDVSDLPTIRDTKVTLYWASGDPSDPILTEITDLELPAGSIDSVEFHVSAAQLGIAPSGTDALVILPDTPSGGLDMGLILEPIENEPATLPPNPLDLQINVFKNLAKDATVKPDGVDPGFYLVDEAAGPEHGEVTMFGDGSFIYTPDENYLGDDSFDYYIEGASGASLRATVTIHIIPFNGTALTKDQQHQIDVDSAFQGQLEATDDEGDDLTFRLDVGPDHGTVTINPSGTFTYEPDAGYVGFDGFSFIATDGFTDSLPGFIGFEVLSDNTEPTVNDDSFDVNESSVFGTLIGSVTASDAEGDGLTYVIIEGNTNNAFAINPETGAITVNNPTALVFASNPTFALTIEVTDDGAPALSSIATIAIDVKLPGGGLGLTLGGAASFTKKQQPISVLPDVVVQVPGNEIGGGRLVISVDLVRKNAKLFDTIPVLSFASLLGTVSGPTVLPDGRSQLTVDLDDFIRGEDVQTFLRAFKFTTRGRGLKARTRTVRVQLFDSEGNESNVLQQTINVHRK